MKRGITKTIIKTVTLAIGGNILVSTSDGWEYGIIKGFIGNKIKVYVELLGESNLYKLGDVKI